MAHSTASRQRLRELQSTKLLKRNTNAAHTKGAAISSIHRLQAKPGLAGYQHWSLRPRKWTLPHGSAEPDKTGPDQREGSARNQRCPRNQQADNTHAFLPGAASSGRGRRERQGRTFQAKFREPVRADRALTPRTAVLSKCVPGDGFFLSSRY